MTDVVRRWLALAGLWLVPGLISTGQVVMFIEMRDEPLPLGVLLWMVPWQVYTLATPLIVRIVRRWPLERAAVMRRLPIHIAAMVGIGLPFSGVWLVCAMYSGLEFSRLHPVVVLLGILVKNAAYWILAYGAVVTVTLIGDSQRKNREAAVLQSELSAQLAQAQLAALRMQLHPHFLFNTLNAIEVLVRKRDIERATRMLNGLGELLRLCLDSVALQQVTLGEELSFIDRYLEIEQIRFGDRVRVSRSIPDALLAAQIPNLLLQPLIENALKHGLEPKLGGGTLELSARRDGDRLRIEIRDDGAGLGRAHDAGRGIGLPNVRTRLRQLYQDDQSFTLEPASPGVRVVVEIPYSEAPRPAQALA